MGCVASGHRLVPLTLPDSRSQAAVDAFLEQAEGLRDPRAVCAALDTLIACVAHAKEAIEPVATRRQLWRCGGFVTRALRGHPVHPGVAQRGTQFFHDLSRIDRSVAMEAPGEAAEAVAGALVRHGGVARENGSMVLLHGLAFLTHLAFGPEGCTLVNGVCPMVLGVSCGHWGNASVVLAGLAFSGE